ncbi:MAG: precorrin-2 C(20)-methyltransferase [Tannerellaceae bacterium]|nr:precorrin-2 C(20)-methyltransferase [Tannerellaceae bacterium]
MDNPVVFVSLGPGEAELVTVKGYKALQEAEVIFCPGALLPDGKSSSRAYTILCELGVDIQRILLFNLPMRKDRVATWEVYRQVAQQVRQAFEAGKKVAVVAEGDCGFYSSIQYIWEELEALAIPLQRIAGVPAFIACGAMAGIHLASQEEELDVVPGTLTLPALQTKLSAGRTVVVMKPSQCEKVLKEAMQTLPDTVFHYFENVGIPDKKFYTADSQVIMERPFPYFSLLIILANKNTIL